jgi:hypothetical protein
MKEAAEDAQDSSSGHVVGFSPSETEMAQRVSAPAEAWTHLLDIAASTNSLSPQEILSCTRFLPTFVVVFYF